MQLFFRPANVSGATNTRGSTPLIRAAANNDLEIVKLLLEHGADATVYLADRQTPIHAVLAGRANEKDALELIRVLHDAGTDVNSVALIVHIEEVRGGSALHYAVRKRYKDVIRLLASYGVDMNLKDQDGLTALDYTQSRGFMPFMALPDAALQRRGGAAARAGRDGDDGSKNPVWPVLGPPQGMWPDIWPIGEPVVHPPIYTARHHVQRRLAACSRGAAFSAQVPRRSAARCCPFLRCARSSTGHDHLDDRISAAGCSSVHRAPVATSSRCAATATAR